jgi:hypothetical protein
MTGPSSDLQQHAKASSDADPLLVGSAQRDTFRTSTSRRSIWCIESVAGGGDGVDVHWAIEMGSISIADEPRLTVHSAVNQGFPQKLPTATESG